jgi:Flp pilus assembly pilin Flp
MSLFQKRNSQRGSSVTEYTLLATILSIFVLGAVQATSSSVDSVFRKASLQEETVIALSRGPQDGGPIDGFGDTGSSNEDDDDFVKVSQGGGTGSTTPGITTGTDDDDDSPPPGDEGEEESDPDGGG